MKLYYSKGACSLMVRIILNELGIDADYESVDLKTKKTETGKDYFSINPKGAVPLLELDNLDKLTENAVILQYLADNMGAISLLPAVGNIDRYHVLEWLNFLASDVHKSFGPLFNPSIDEALKSKLFYPIIESKFSYVDKQLENRQYLQNENFTLPDAYLFIMLTWARKFKFDFKKWENLARYYKNLSMRKSVKTSLEQEGIPIG